MEHAPDARKFGGPLGDLLPVDVEVVIFGRPQDGYILGFPSGEEFDRPLGDRTAVSFAARRDERLVDVLRRGGRTAGVAIAAETHDGWPSYFSFIARDGSKIVPWRHSVPILNDQGHAVWGTPAHGLLYGNVLDSAEAGLFPGDPRRLVLLLYGGFGDGPGVSWDEMLASLAIAGQVLEHMATAGGVVGLLEYGRRVAARTAAKVERRRRATESSWSDWSNRGAWPEDIRQLIYQPWTAKALGTRLGCSTKDAVALLDGHGATYDEITGVWNPSQHRLELLDEPVPAGEGELVEALVWAAIMDRERPHQNSDQLPRLTDEMSRILQYWVDHGAIPPRG